MEANAYNKHIRDQIEAINNKYVKDMEHKGYMLSDMDITSNTAKRQGEGILSSGLSLLGLGAAPKVARARGEGIMGEGLFDDIGRGFSKGFMMPFHLLGLGKEGGISTGGRRRGRPRKMAGVSTGGEIALNMREQNPNYLLSEPVSGGAVSGGRKRGRKSKAMMKGEGILSSVLGAVGLGMSGGAVSGGAVSGGMRRKMTTIPYNVTGGAVSGGRRGRKSKAMMEGEGILSSALGMIGLGKKAGAVSGGAVSGGRMYRKRGGIQTGGLARAVGSGMGELEGSGFFDDVLDKVSSIAGTVKKGVDIGKDLGLFKGKGRKRAGVSTGGAVSGGASPWITHVKSYAKKHGVSYKDALKQAKATYRK